MNPPIRHCAGCGDRLRAGPLRWCSEACRVAAYRDRVRAELEPGWGTPGYYPRSAVRFPTCTECGAVFSTRSPIGQTCGAACSKARKNRVYRERYAADRAVELERHKRRRASAPLEERMRNRARNQKRRAVVYDADAESFSPLEIFDRDSWICAICDRVIDPAAVFPDPWSASLDHRVPLSRGGKHTRENARATHLHCNCSRGNRDEVPLPDMGSYPDKGGTEDGWTRPCPEGPASPSWSLTEGPHPITGDPERAGEAADPPRKPLVLQPGHGEARTVPVASADEELVEDVGGLAPVG